MNIHYITRINFLSNKAHVYNVSKTCEALNQIDGVNVFLVSTDNSLVKEELVKYFFSNNNIEKPFPIISINSLSNYFKKNNLRFINWLETVFVNFSLSLYVISNHKSIDVLYYRDGSTFLPVLIAKFLFRKPVFFESHAVLVKNYRRLMDDLLGGVINGVVVISNGLRDYYKNINNNIVVSFCAASEPERFKMITESREELRKMLNLPTNKVILGYTGNMYKTGNSDPYGVDDILRALPILPDNVIFVGVGKKGSETKDLEKLAIDLGISERVHLLPWVSRGEVVKYILAFDILLIPSAGARIGNSPTKMFEYLSSGRTIIAANTKAISEVLHDGKNALLVDYNDPASWARAVSMVVENPGLSASLIEQASKDAELYSWVKRGNDIFGFLKKTIDENNA